MAQQVIGVPRERKLHEGRVGLTPDGVRSLLSVGASVIVEKDAGKKSGFSDQQYRKAGAVIVRTEKEIFSRAEVIVKVKELLPEEYRLIPLLRGKTIFTYLHLAGVDPRLTRLLLEHNVTGIAYEAVEEVVNGIVTHPLLAPMSKIAGEQAVESIVKAKRVGTLVIIGGGVAGEAAFIRACMHPFLAITLFDVNPNKVQELADRYPPGFASPSTCILERNKNEENDFLNVLQNSDAVICAPMRPNSAEAPIVLSEEHFKVMKPGAYVVDIAIDQGGSTVYTRGRPTKPKKTFTEGGIVFSATPNIPGSTVPKEATRALTDVTLPYVIEIAKEGSYFAMKESLSLRKGLQTFAGFVTNRHVAKHCGLNDLSFRPTEHFFEE